MPEEQNAGSQQQPKKKPWLIIVLAAVALCGAAAAGYFFFLTPGGESGEPESLPLHSFSLGNTVVNLGKPYSSSYLRVGISLAYRDESTVELLNEKKDQIKDLIIDILRSKDIDDVATVEKTEALRRELMQAVNKVLEGRGEIQDVYFTEFIVQ
ncbi:MAG: flagellar basal body-associated FliL family protein [Peptococcaceae bacterium]|nr:flagellar basal body-associated FliL family protein [Peptococcaceae bacterium]